MRKLCFVRDVDEFIDAQILFKIPQNYVKQNYFYGSILFPYVTYL